MFIAVSVLLAVACLVPAIAKLGAHPKMLAAAGHFGIPWSRLRTEFQGRTGNAESFAQVPGSCGSHPSELRATALDAALQPRATSVSGFGYRLAAALMAVTPRSVLCRVARAADKRMSGERIAA